MRDFQNIRRIYQKRFEPKQKKSKRILQKNNKIFGVVQILLIDNLRGYSFLYKREYLFVKRFVIGRLKLCSCSEQT